MAILGWRLGTPADKLRENELATVRALPIRFAELERSKPLVASISITSVVKPDAELARTSPK